MKDIKFEGLGIDLHINSIAFNIGNVTIYWYGIILVLAIASAILFCKKDDGKYGIKYESILKLAIILLPISIVSARLYYILFKLDYYFAHPSELFLINNGGIAIYGAIIGAIVTIALFCKKTKIKVLDLMDYIAPYLALGQAIGRWGNFFNQEAFGVETTNIFRMGIIENGKYIEVHPTFLYESICTFAIFIVLFLIRNRRKYAGQLSYLYFVMYGIVRAIIEGLRTDSLMIGDIRVSQLLSIILCVVFTSILIYKEYKFKKENKKESKV